MFNLKQKQCNVEEVAIFPAGSEGFSQKNLNCSVEEGLKRFKLVADQAVKDGLRVRGYVSCVVGCPYDGPIHPKGIAKVICCLAPIVTMHGTVYCFLLITLCIKIASTIC